MKIVFLDAATLGDTNLQKLEKLGDFVKFDTTKPEQTLQRLQNVDVVITNKVLITKDIIEKTNLKLICVAATGTNNVDIKAALDKNIPVKNVAGYSTNSVVTQTFATLLTLLSNVNFYNDYSQSPFGWVKSEIFTNVDRPILELANKKFGVIGLGNIGYKIAKIAKAFDYDVCYYSTSGKNNNKEFKSVSLDELLTNCDIVSVHCALNEKTNNLITKNELKKLKSGAVIMNFGRGGIINENDLAKALDEQNIKVGLDVLSSEPIKPNSPFLSVKNKQNLIITPHTAWTSVEARKILVDKICQNIEEFVKKLI